MDQSASRSSALSRAAAPGGTGAPGMASAPGEASMPKQHGAPGRVLALPRPAVRPTRGPPAAQEPDSPAMMLRLAEDHDRIAEGLNDVVVRRLFAAGLALETALALVGEHRAAGRIQHAIGELDRAIGDLRDTVFHCRRREALPAGAPD